MDADHMTDTRRLPTLNGLDASNRELELADTHGIHRRPAMGRNDTDADFAPDSKSLPDYSMRDDKADGKHSVDIDASSVHSKEEIYDIRSAVPLPDIGGPNQETQQLTVRAVVVGSALGAIVGASNVSSWGSFDNLGLKTGWTFGSSLFGAIFGFAILKSLSRVLPEKFGGGPFGPRENTVAQTSATAAAGLGIIFVGGVPAFYQLGLLTTPKNDLGRWIGFCAVSAFYGMFFALPLRKWYILKLKLVFPSPTATALTIRTLHSGKAGAEAAAKKIKTLIASFSGAILLRIVSQYAPGVLWDWHVGVWLHNFGWKSALAMDNWGWFFEWTPAFLGAGILAGVNASLSFYGGSILAWGIIGPSIIHTGLATGRDRGDGYWSYTSMPANAAVAKTTGVSPRYWNLWVGVLVMIVASFVELGCNMAIMSWALYKQYKGRASHERLIEDPAPQNEQVSWKFYVPAIFVIVIITCVVLAKSFDMSVGLSILAILLGFLWSFIAVQSAGVTDINPVSTTAKASQIVVGGVTQSHNYAVNAAGYMPHAAQLNLQAGCIAGAAAAQAADMVGDLKTGHLLGASPRNMFYAQVCGAIVSIFLVPGLFVLFATAYPCLLDSQAATCSFAGPSIAAWRAVAIAVASKDGLPLPSASGYTAIGLSIAAGITILAKYLFIPEKHWEYIPNWTAIGLAFTLPQTQYSAAMSVGAISAYYWKKKAPHNFDMYAYALAAGLCSGEGIGGCVNAVLTIAGVDGEKYGSGVGCPASEWCG